MEIARVEGEVAFYKEKINLLSNSSNKKDLQDITLAKIKVDNYETFLSRLKTNKASIMRNVSLVVDKYEGEYAEVFKKFFFETKSVEQISKEMKIPLKQVKQITRRLNYDVIDYLGVKKRDQ